MDASQAAENLTRTSAQQSLTGGDRYLVIRLKSADPEVHDRALREVTDRFYDLIFKFIYNMIRHSDDADDLTVETFKAFGAGIGRFRGDASLKSWIYKIAFNKVKNYPRKKPWWEVLQTGGPSWANFRDPRPGPEEECDRKDTSTQLRKQIDKLPDKFRTVIILFYFEELRVRKLISSR